MFRQKASIPMPYYANANYTVTTAQQKLTAGIDRYRYTHTRTHYPGTAKQCSVDLGFNDDMKTY